MTKHQMKLPDSIEAIANHMLFVSGKLKTGELPGTELRELGFLLAELAETVHYYADKLGSPLGRHALREPPDDTSLGP
ncbi:hypothetical protein DMH03_13065 [Amycolatopsis sp. WAC 01376]|uniref:hypothetical protein n=1 Tax=Amycolatopsis sp. WAC 01376 TaxID=2203195 RepID=UPI000F777C74|nr:hypothetical protein [Amycolatopsis sp. WAC 01376]RSM62971.1 hypothetical protein DMH03_13065 [Amycolatopsis sp. WAC 01376]